ncbi:flagellar filament capping protein FliD [Mesoterricola sediminis]|uniref:Flagellar hook-associated protein 2 n=1 Tax=Mesoterricola sediminis TaxID=2927980 RepID=A0AA48GWC5_9BACT|nr:flagellar filament capping protein FliD [Mesoterricola sediminis]BDU78822.1 hypothetical protein METESE_37800 [Mesoterricola sediminis]
MASAISFQGLSTNLPTDQLIAAIINQQSQPMVRMQNQQATNNKKSLALQTLRTDLTSLSTAIDSLTISGFQSNKVTSTDSQGTYATATASGAASGQYDLTVKSLATRSRLVLPTALATGAAVGTGTYTLTDMSGRTASITIDSTNNTLSGLAQAINNAKDASGTALDVGATVIQTNADGTSQLVLSANNTGVGSGGATTFSLQMAAGSALDPGATGTFTSSTATNSNFILNGVEMWRSSNAVSDAVAGVTFNLNQAQTDLTKTTTFTVAMDTDAATKAMQTVVDKFNAFYKDYKDNAKFTQNDDGTYTKGVFNMDMTVRNIVSQVSQALMGSPSGVNPATAYNSAASIGLKTNQDGTIALDTTAFTDALTKGSRAVSNLFANSGSSTSPLLTFVSSGSKTTSSPIAFSVANNAGTLTGSFTTTGADGNPATYTLTSTDGNFYGATGTPLEGLVLQASAGATGTLTVSTGISRLLQDLNNTLSDSNPGDIGGLISDLSASNYRLQIQIDQQKDYLDRSKASLQKLYSNLETVVGQLQAAGQSLSSL